MLTSNKGPVFYSNLVSRDILIPSQISLSKTRKLKKSFQRNQGQLAAVLLCSVVQCSAALGNKGDPFKGKVES